MFWEKGWRPDWHGFITQVFARLLPLRDLKEKHATFYIFRRFRAIAKNLFWASCKSNTNHKSCQIKNFGGSVDFDSLKYQHTVCYETLRAHSRICCAAKPNLRRNENSSNSRHCVKRHPQAWIDRFSLDSCMLAIFRLTCSQVFFDGVKGNLSGEMSCWH